MALLVAALVAVHVWAAVGTEFSPHKLRDIGNTLEFLKEGWPPKWAVVPEAVRASVTTLQIALLGTTLPLVVALPLSFLAARTTSPSPLLYNALRGGLSVLRSVPEFVFALALIPAIGLGPFPGVIPLAVHNLGVLGKMISELIESAPTGPQEAVAATGARRVLVMCFGVLPQIAPDVISQAFYRLEVNVRASVLLGFIGAGGIGQDLFVAFRVFQYRGVVIHVAAILALVISRLIKQRALTQARAGEILGIKQPHVSALMRGRSGAFSVERLMQVLTALGQDVEITGRPTRKRQGALSVSAG